MGEYSKSGVHKSDTNPAKLGSGGQISRPIVCIHLIQILIWHLRVSPGLLSKTNVEKRKMLWWLCIQIVFSFVENKAFLCPQYSIFRKSFQRAVWKLPSPNLETAHKNYKNIPIFSEKGLQASAHENIFDVIIIVKFQSII